VGDPKSQKSSKELPEAQRKAIAAEVEAFIAKHVARNPKMTLRQIAEMHKVPHGMLSAMRKGKGIGILTLIRLRELTGHTIDDMLRLDSLETERERQIVRIVEREIAKTTRPPPRASEPEPKGYVPDDPPSRPRRRP
jgi:hypothetical protein